MWSSHDPAVPQTVAEACVAGRGDHYIEYGGYTWRTLDGADPEGTKYGAPNGGCQVIPGQASRKSNKSPSNYLPLPAGWVVAPNDATSNAVVAAHGWSTDCVVLADGRTRRSGNTVGTPGDRCGYSGTNYLATSGGTYTVARCTDGSMRVLTRCG